MDNKISKLLEELTIEEKIGLCSGLDQWHTKPVDRLGIPSIMVSDGPHGLRKQVDSEGLGIGESTKATCFPTASLMACSWDPDLVYEVGQQLGKECINQDVQVILGPGVNMKRSPLCGRNFEYFSEDPILSGNIAAAWINGVQSQGIGTSLKHFAANNQERRRMNVSAEIDERALHEYYLKGFEIAVKKSQPRTVMCSYNKINDVYSSENRKLLTEILREKWGFNGMTVSDWGATHYRPDGIRAGLNLEMPSSNGYNDADIRNALETGELSMESLDQSVASVLQLVLEMSEKRDHQVKEPLDDEAHQLAIRAARESMVLLKNEGVLPLAGNSLAVFGDFWNDPRFQGAGSSKVTSRTLDTPADAFKKAGLRHAYLGGYDIDKLRFCDGNTTIVIFAGLPESYESEGLDRISMAMPENQNAFIEAAAATECRVVVVLIGGAPIEIPWADSVDAILLSYLGGEGMGTAISELLIGKFSPCGKLAETWPLKAEDPACSSCFPGDRLHVLYKESIYNGYRYYDTFNIPVRYSFGHGLSYSSFSYSDISIDKPEAGADDIINVSFKLENTGSCTASEISMAFSDQKDRVAFMPRHQLLGWTKTTLAPGETKTVSIAVSSRDLGYYNTETGEFYCPSGEYNLAIGSSVDKLLLSIAVRVRSVAQPETDYRASADCYYSSISDRLIISDSAFASLLGRDLPAPAEAAVRPYGPDNCLEDVENTPIGKVILGAMNMYMRIALRAEKGQDAMMLAGVREMPLGALAMFSGGIISRNRLQGLLDLFNGKTASGLLKLLRK